MNRLTRRHPTHACLIIQYPQKITIRVKGNKIKVRPKHKGKMHIYSGKFTYSI